MCDCEVFDNSEKHRLAEYCAKCIHHMACHYKGYKCYYPGIRVPDM